LEEITQQILSNEILQYLLIGFVGLAAGIINTLAGGGSLLTLSTLIFLGLHPSIANATNRLGIVSQTFSGIIGYKSKGVFNFRFGLYLGISALFGALIGAKIAIDISGDFFNRILAIIMIVVAVMVILNPKKRLKNKLNLEKLTGKYLVISVISFFFIGIYGGFINAGIGIFIMVFLNTINRLNLVKTNATKVLIVFTYTLGALILFAVNGKINWIFGLFLASGNAIGAWWASRWSVIKGEGVIRIAMFIVVSIMAIKLWFFN